MIECKAGEGWEQEEGEESDDVNDHVLATTIHVNTNTNMSVEESNEVSYIFLVIVIVSTLMKFKHLYNFERQN